MVLMVFEDSGFMVISFGRNHFLCIYLGCLGFRFHGNLSNSLLSKSSTLAFEQRVEVVTIRLPENQALNHLSSMLILLFFPSDAQCGSRRRRLFRGF